MTPQEILLKAALEVEKGWCQGTMEDTNNNVCVMGAIYRASFGKVYANFSRLTLPQMDRQCLAVYILRNYLEKTTGRRMITDWNDMPERTQEEVINALREAAK